MGIGFITQANFVSLLAGAVYFCSLPMYSLKYNPSQLTGEMLDAFLEKGWFRMGQSVFITHFLRFREQFYPAVWLRYRLNDNLLKTIEAKLKKTESRFQVEVQPWVPSEEQEALFTLYRNHSGLVMAESLSHILMDDHPENIFPSFQITIRDGNRLVGLGIFDLGAQTAAGISNIYHPEYKKYSLGKMLMLLKIRHCIGLGQQWFYPGYAVPGYRRFDYKLQVLPEHTFYFHSPQEAWMEYIPAKGLPDYMEQIIARLAGLKHLFEKAGRPALIVFYPPFDIRLINDMLPDVVTTPAFLMLSYDAGTEAGTIVIFDVARQAFGLATCMPLAKNGWNTEGGHLVCFDVMQVLDRTDFIFSEEEILKIAVDL